MLVGLSGYARAGKDTVADVLVQESGYTRVGFADKLRDALYALNPIVEIEDDWSQVEVQHSTKPIREFNNRVTRRVQDVIDNYGWDGYKATPYVNEIRPLLQRLGTEAGREVISDTIWVDAALNIDVDNIVISDCRFPNEAQAVKDRGGIVVRVQRPGTVPANPHISETALDDWAFDDVLWNDGSLDEFRDKVRKAHEQGKL